MSDSAAPTSQSGGISDLPGIEITTDQGAHYGVVDHGAHTWAWQPAGERPVLWLSAATEPSDGKPIRGGVPVIFPWFANGRSGDQQPAHGPVRTAAWERDEVVDDLANGGPLTVRHRWTGALPQPADVSMTVRFSQDELRLTMTVTNTGESEFTFEQALHTYLAVSDIRQVVVRGLDGVDYLDRAKHAPRLENVQVGDVTFTAETDRVYLSENTVQVVDPGWQRTLEVSKQGSSDTVVWNPWVDKAAAMPDFGDDEWPGMVCIEAANVLDHAVTLPAGQTHDLVQVIALV
ncbi:D-hexose-6-phosphate mutarotase [Aestuariimicrobium kwangyangense]|uniref:D-hexose-6-phosphate mutarotase n=1 Tax=Aestuariimicrobium kwangyangense TaxID=396389 RepID=UPI0003B44494|nr:D-hexose-6-phosphate mutarotase [Aestuariimicrobium kwangyangense]